MAEWHWISQTYPPPPPTAKDYFTVSSLSSNRIIVTHKDPSFYLVYKFLSGFEWLWLWNVRKRNVQKMAKEQLTLNKSILFLPSSSIFHVCQRVGLAGLAIWLKSEVIGAIPLSLSMDDDDGIRTIPFDFTGREGWRDNGNVAQVNFRGVSEWVPGIDLKVSEMWRVFTRNMSYACLLKIILFFRLSNGCVCYSCWPPLVVVDYDCDYDYTASGWLSFNPFYRVGLYYGYFVFLQ